MKNHADIKAALSKAIDPFVTKLSEQLGGMLADHAEKSLAIAGQAAIARMRAELDAHAVVESKPATSKITVAGPPPAPAGELTVEIDGKAIALDVAEGESQSSIAKRTAAAINGRGEPMVAPAKAEKRAESVPEPRRATIEKRAKSKNRPPEQRASLQANGKQPPRCSRCGNYGNVRGCGKPSGHPTLNPGARESQQQPSAAREPASDDEDEGPPVEALAVKPRVVFERTRQSNGDGRPARWRVRRGDAPRAKSIPQKKLTREVLRAGALMYPPVDVERPRTRGECRDGEHAGRPCPFVACKHHLYLDVNAETGTIKLNFPDLEPWELANSCSLDVADRGGITLEETGEIMNLTRERIRQLELRGFDMLRALATDRGLTADDATGFAHARNEGAGEGEAA